MDLEEKIDEVMAVSEDGGDAAAGGDGTVSPSPVTVPKKRGRPSNPDKQPKKPVTGRGRGRPAKNEVGAGAPNKKTTKADATLDGSDEEGTASDGGSPLPNGDSSSGSRGRPPKAKRKLAHTIEATGRGRGRPKKSAKADTGDDEDEAADDNEDAESSDYKPGKKAPATAAKVAKKGRGRPKKVQNSDDDSSDDKLDDDEERRPLGRPPSGGVSLNIAATGRGQGRPKKIVAAPKRVAKVENGSGETPTRKRGRPVTTGKGPYQPSGKPRGRPKAASSQDKDSQDDDENDADEKPSEDAANNSGDDDDVKMNSESEDGI